MAAVRSLIFKPLGGKQRAFPPSFWPTLTFTDQLSLHFNGDDIDVVHVPSGGALIRDGKSLEETVALKPTADLDGEWGNGPIRPDQIVEEVYADLKRRIL